MGLRHLVVLLVQRDLDKSRSPAIQLKGTGPDLVARLPCEAKYTTFVQKRCVLY